MGTHILEAKHSQKTSVAWLEQNEGEQPVGHGFSVMPVPSTPQLRRGEPRTEYRQVCSYGVLEAIDAESVVIEQGEAFVFNRSQEGMLLLMGGVPHLKQLTQVHTARSRWGKTVNVFEARWAKPIHVKSHGNLYLVGYRRTFGPCHYLAL